MYLYLVNFLRILHGLCLLYSVIGVQSGIAVSRREAMSVDSNPSPIDKERMIIKFTKNKMAESGVNDLCSNAPCSQDRKKRSPEPDSSHAQNKQTGSKRETKRPGQSSPTKFAFGNAALPNPSKSRNGKPKSKRRKG